MILVGGIPTPLKHMKVSWDDEISNWMEVIKFNETYESQLGWLNSQLNGKHKIHVPNHQSDPYYRHISPWNNDISSRISCAKGHTRSDSSSLMRWCDRTAWVPGSANASPAWQGWILRMDEMVGWCCVNLKPALKDMQNGKWTKPTLEVSSTMFNLCVSTTKRMWIMSASVTPVIFMAEMVPRSQPFWLLWVVQIQGPQGSSMDLFRLRTVALMVPSKLEKMPTP